MYRGAQSSPQQWGGWPGQGLSPRQWLPLVSRLYQEIRGIHHDIEAPQHRLHPNQKNECTGTCAHKNVLASAVREANSVTIADLIHLLALFMFTSARSPFVAGTDRKLGPVQRPGLARRSPSHSAVPGGGLGRPTGEGRLHRCHTAGVPTPRAGQAQGSPPGQSPGVTNFFSVPSSKMEDQQHPLVSRGRS